MKRSLQTLMFIALLVPAGLLAADILDNIAASISSGNAQAVSQYFEANVTLTIDDKEAPYSKAQAQIVLQNFFAKNPVKRFALNHRGSSAGGKQFGIGTLETATGQYRVYYLVLRNKTAYTIQEMRFEKQQ